jgi:hypothetical protein
VPLEWPRGSVKKIIEHLADQRPQTIGKALARGLAAPPPRSFPYIQLAAHYLDGKPVERIEVRSDSRLLFIGARPLIGQPEAQNLLASDADIQAAAVEDEGRK